MSVVRGTRAVQERGQVLSGTLPRPWRRRRPAGIRRYVAVARLRALCSSIRALGRRVRDGARLKTQPRGDHMNEEGG